MKTLKRILLFFLLRPGADLGLKGWAAISSSLPGIRPPADTKGHAFVLFWDITFWLTDPEVFLKAPSAPMHTSLEGKGVGLARFEKRYFLVKNFRKKKL